MTETPWKMTESGFIVQTAETAREDTPIFMALARENNGVLFADLCKRSWD
jgi:hypothetical protein